MSATVVTTRPSVTVHFAQTLDGRIATQTGSSRWISGAPSLALAHRLRATHDAVLVGVGTVLADDPSLTTRLVRGRSPQRVVLDSRVRLPLGSRLLADPGAPTTVIATLLAAPARIAAVRAAGANVVLVAADEHGQVDLAAALSALADQGVRSVLIEGGRAVITSSLRAEVVDRLVVTIAAKLIGSGVEAVGDLGVSELGAAINLTDARMTTLGAEFVLEGRPVWPSAGSGCVRQYPQATRPQRPAPRRLAANRGM